MRPQQPKPDTNKKCANDTCQHTCDRPEKCQEAWILRYWVNGKQLEKSFCDSVHETSGRTVYGSGRKLAQDFQLRGKAVAGLPRNRAAAARSGRGRNISRNPLECDGRH